MAQLHTKVNSREKVVGWFSTGSQVSGSDALIQSFYGNETPNPVHLTLDTSLQDGHMGVRAYVSKTLSIGGKELAREFQEVHCEVNRIEAEKAAGDLLTAQTVHKLPGDLEGLTTSLDKLEATLAAAKAYVDAVIAGQQPGGNDNNNVAVGRALSEAVAAVPHFSTEEFQRLIKDSQNDVVLTLYLGNLIKAHISLADRLGTMQLPLL
jgi:translation initiation factor 3 subunit F